MNSDIQGNIRSGLMLLPLSLYTLHSRVSECVYIYTPRLQRYTTIHVYVIICRSLFEYTGTDKYVFNVSGEKSDHGVAVVKEVRVLHNANANVL